MTENPLGSQIVTALLNAGLMLVRLTCEQEIDGYERIESIGSFVAD